MFIYSNRHLIRQFLFTFDFIFFLNKKNCKILYFGFKTQEIKKSPDLKVVLKRLPFDVRNMTLESRD